MSHDCLSDPIRAAVFVAPGAPLELREFPRPQLAAGEVLVRISCCTLCGSDLHTYLGRRPTVTPTVLGHEALGRVAELGPGNPIRDLAGQPLKVGDRVSWSVVASCEQCFFCRAGLPQKCEKLFKYGHESCCNGHPLSGGLAEFCQLAVGTPIARLPEEIPDVVASSANCATATAAAALRAVDGCRDQVVLVQGAGLLGLTMSAMARVGGAAAVIVADVDPARSSLASLFGATFTVNLADSPQQLERIVSKHTAGRGVDLAFEMSGTAAAMEQGLELLRIGGRYVLVGAVSPTRPVKVDADQLVRRMLTLQGIHNYAPQDLAAAIEFLTIHHAKFPFQELVTGVFSLAQADAAFGHAVETSAVRTAVRPQLTLIEESKATPRRRPFSRPIASSCATEQSEVKK